MSQDQYHQQSPHPVLSVLKEYLSPVQFAGYLAGKAIASALASGKSLDASDYRSATFHTLQLDKFINECKDKGGFDPTDPQLFWTDEIGPADEEEFKRVVRNRVLGKSLVGPVMIVNSNKMPYRHYYEVKEAVDYGLHLAEIPESEYSRRLAEQRQAEQLAKEAEANDTREAERLAGTNDHEGSALTGGPDALDHLARPGAVREDGFEGDGRED